MIGQDRSPSVVTGLLRDFPLERLLGFLEACGATGRLALTEGFQIGAVYLSRGVVVDAHDAQGGGFEAFTRALLGDAERYCFETEVTGVEARLAESTAQLILRVLRSHPPSERLLRSYAFAPGTLVFSTEAAASHRAPIMLTPTEASILAEVREGGNTRSVSARVGIDLTLTRHILVRLAAAGLAAGTSVALRQGDQDGVTRLVPSRRLQLAEFLKRLNPAAATGFRISFAEERVFELVDGRRTVGEISCLLDQDAGSVLRALEHLHGLGLLATPAIPDSTACETE